MRSATAGLPGHRVRDRAALPDRRDQGRDDRGVDLLEIGRLLVPGVEALEVEPVARQLDDRRVPGRAHEAPVRPHDRGARRGQHEIGAGGSEADDHDLARGHPAGWVDGVVGVVGAVGVGVAPPWPPRPAGFVVVVGSLADRRRLRGHDAQALSRCAGCGRTAGSP